jgi:hypothetical protein
VIVERVARFIAEPERDSFADLALAAFAFQFERIEPYRRMCERRRATPATVADWREVPLVPALAFKSLRLHAAPARETFRSSGTTQGERSVHHHPFPELYRRTIDASFPHHCLPGPPPVPMLSLIPGRAQLPDSSLGFMIDHALRRWGAADSVTAFSARGVEVAKARSWLGALQRARRPGLVLATAFALAELASVLARQDLRFRLPPGSAVFETGGFKGRRGEIAPAELAERIGDRLGIPAGAIVREYGMTELTSQFYTRALAGGDPELFLGSAWTRVRVLEPATLVEAPAGTAGLLAVFDLANLGSAVHLLTEDLGVAEGEGFRLLGRAPGAELRGCSLTVEEMTPAPPAAAR